LRRLFAVTQWEQTRQKLWAMLGRLLKLPCRTDSLRHPAAGRTAGA
jgi:hypothetical protein